MRRLYLDGLFGFEPSHIREHLPKVVRQWRPAVNLCAGPWLMELELGGVQELPCQER